MVKRKNNLRKRQREGGNGKSGEIGTITMSNPNQSVAMEKSVEKL